MEAEARDGFEKQKSRIVKAICAGNLVFNDASEPVYSPQLDTGVPSITFSEPRGASLMAMDGKKQNHDVTKMFAVMADMSKTHTNLFSKMARRDLYVCMAVTTLFLD